MTTKRNLLLLLLFLIGSPVVIGMSKQFMLETPQLAVVCCFLFLLNRTFYFQRKKATFLSGLVFGTAFLCKASCVFYCVSFLTVYFFIALLKTKQNKIKIEKFFLNTFVFSLGFFTIAGIYLLGNIDLFLFELKGQKKHGIAEGDPYPFSLASFVYYFKILFQYFGKINFLFLLMGAFISILKFYKKKNFLKITPFIFSFLFLYFFFTLRWNKDYRYLIGIIPFCCLGIVGFCGLFESKKFIFNKIPVSLLSKITIFFIFISTAFSQIGQVFNINLKILPHSQFGYTMPSSFTSVTNINPIKTIRNFQSLLNNLKIKNTLQEIDKPYVPDFYQKLLSNNNLKKLSLNENSKFTFSLKKNKILIERELKNKNKFIFAKSLLTDTVIIFKLHQEKKLNQSQKLYINFFEKGKITADYNIPKMKLYFSNGKNKTLKNISIKNQKNKIWQGKEKINKIEIESIQCFYNHQKWQMLFLAQFAKMYPLDFMTKENNLKIIDSNSYSIKNKKLLIRY